MSSFHRCMRKNKDGSFSGKDRVLFKNKGNSMFNYSTNQYDHLLDTPDRDNFKRFLQIKDTYLKSDQK